jgi:TRAP transporter TAXI family solute receptor
MTSHRFAAVMAIAMAGCGAAVAAPAPIAIATGPVSGFAFPLGGEICRLYETLTPDKARCTAAATDGSVEDLNRLRSGDIALAIVQSDVAADAVSASGPFSGNPPFAELRSLLGFYGEPLTILVRGDGPVKLVDDLKGQRVAVGAPGAPEPLFADFLTGLGWGKADLGGVVEMPRSEQVAALCSGKIAAIVVTAPHPNGFVREAMAACHATMLDLAGPGIDGAVESHPPYAQTRLDLSVYGIAGGTMQSFGPRAVLVTTAKLENATVDRLLDGIFKRLDKLRTSHPALAGLDANGIAASAGLGAERHLAAVKYLTDHKIGDAPAPE